MGIAPALSLSQHRALPEPGRAAPVSQRTLTMEFDIGSQPLHDALQEYSRVTGRSLLYDSRVVQGLKSSPARGRLTLAQALNRLIAGTGMVARYTSSDAFVLVPRPESATPPQPQAAAGDRQRYYAMLQRRILEALCADPAARPGAYRVALRFRSDGDNAISQLQVHAERQPVLEARVRARLEKLPLAGPPPAGVAQPVTLLVVPSKAPCRPGGAP